MFLQLRDKFDRFELVCVLESDNVEDIRNQAEAAERSAECARRELDAMLGKWVTGGAGASAGETTEGEVRVPVDPQLRGLVAEGPPHPDGWSLSGSTGEVVDYS